MDLQAIATALAGQFASVTATSGTETENTTATTDLPDNIAKGPALVVFPPTGDLGLVMGPKLDDHYIFPVRLLRDPVGMYVARTRWLYAWATAMRTKVQQNIDLDVPGVAEAQATSMRLEIEGHRYSSVDGTFGTFDVVELLVDVHVYEVTSIGI